MKILVVDDEPQARKSIARRLNKLGYNNILEAENGKKALELTINKKPDLVFADIRMPIMDGIEFLRNIRNTEYKTLIVFVSGYNYFDYAQKAIRLGAFDYLLKPVKETDLNKILNNAEEKLKIQNMKQEAESEMKIQANRGIEFMRHHFIYEIVSQKKLDDGYINQKLSDLEIVFSEDLLCVVLISVDKMFNEHNDISTKDIELIRFSIEKIITEAINNMNISSFFFNTNDGLGCLLNFNEELADSFYEKQNK
jgi:two-component system, response regulator YesN